MKTFFIVVVFVCAIFSVYAQSCQSPTLLVSGVELEGETTCGTEAVINGNRCHPFYISDGQIREAHVYSYTTSVYPEDITVYYSNYSAPASGVAIVSGVCGEYSDSECLGLYYTGTSNSNSGFANTNNVPAQTTVYIYVNTWSNDTTKCVSSYDIMLESTPIPCESPVAEGFVSEDCIDGFMVLVDLTDMGGASSIDISNDVGWGRLQL